MAWYLYDHDNKKYYLETDQVIFAKYLHMFKNPSLLRKGLKSVHTHN